MTVPVFMSELAIHLKLLSFAMHHFKWLIMYTAWEISVRIYLLAITYVILQYKDLSRIFSVCTRSDFGDQPPRCFGSELKSAFFLSAYLYNTMM